MSVSIMTHSLESEQSDTDQRCNNHGSWGIPYVFIVNKQGIERWLRHNLEAEQLTTDKIDGWYSLMYHCIVIVGE